MLSLFPVLKPDVPQCNKKIDLAVMLDSSASIGNDAFQLTKKFTRDLIKRFSFGENKSRFSVMSYAFYIHVPIHFKDFKKSQTFEKSLNSLAWEGSTTFTDRALQTARYEMFSPKYGSRPQQTGWLPHAFSYPGATQPALQKICEIDAAIPSNTNLKSRLRAKFSYIDVFSRTKPRLQVIFRGN